MERHHAHRRFEATRDGAEWIDMLPKDALAIMRSANSHVIVGHHDWSAKNMLMGPGGIAGPVELPVPETRTAEQMAAFGRDYAQARGTALSRVELIETAKLRLESMIIRSQIAQLIRYVSKSPDPYFCCEVTNIFIAAAEEGDGAGIPWGA